VEYQKVQKGKCYVLCSYDVNDTTTNENSAPHKIKL